MSAFDLTPELIDSGTNYKDGYKYYSSRAHWDKTGITVPERIVTEFIILECDGTLKTHQHYAWDGPSGPTFDTENSITASRVHDAFYNLFRLGLLLPSQRKLVDQLLREMCLKRGMWKFRATYWYWGVRRYAANAANPKNLKPILTAP